MVNPKLRFKKPDGTAFPDWEEKPLGSMTEIVARKAPKRSDAPIMMVSQGNGFIYQADKYSRENAGQSLKNYTLLYRGEFAYNHGASKAKPYGVAYELTEEDEARVPYVYHTFRFTEGVNRFWHNSLNTSQMDRKLKRLVSSGVRMDGLLNINYETYMGVPVAVPDETEQKAIADFFASVDEKIEAQERYVAALETQKKELLRQVFAREIRFKDESGQDYPEWSLATVGDIIEPYDERVNNDCDLPILTSSKTEGIVFQADHFGREQSHDISGYCVLPRNYCTYRNRSDGVDFTFNINRLCDKGIVSKFYPVFREKGCNLYLLTLVLNNEPSTTKRIAVTAAGTGQKVLSFSALQSMRIEMPSLPEQQRIADFFTALDAQIENERALLEDWRQLKKGLLQQMFV